jgi:UDP:flavonoid glycosyltransferase YjiC (YdhE family)
MRILFLPYHGIGHFNPCFVAADMLRSEGHDVHFAGAAYFHKLVSQRGYTYTPLKSLPFGSGFERWLNEVEGKKNIYFAELKDRVTNRLYRLRKQELLQVIQTYAPDIILLDAVQATDFIVLYEHLKQRRIRIAILHTMLPTFVRAGRPPVDSLVFPQDKAGHREEVRKLKLRRWKATWKSRMKFLFFDDDVIIQKQILKNRVPRMYCAHELTLVPFSTARIQEIIFAPRTFDFPEFTLYPWQKYVGFMHGSAQQTDLGDDDFDRQRETIWKDKSVDGVKYIYCSFGTVDVKDKQLRDRVLTELPKVARLDSSLRFVVVSKEPFPSGSLDGLEDRFFIFKSVPQRVVLAQADVFITHGGLSSIKEAVEAEVPMLMMPVHQDFDPKGNSARVAYHKLGLLGDPSSFKAKDIHQAITILLTSPHFRHALHQLKIENESYERKDFLQLVLGLSVLQ